MSIPKNPPFLICLPYAGAGPSIFNGWRASLQDSVQMVLPGLAGKEKRFAEAPSTKITDSVNDITRQLRDQLAQNPETPVIVFGHSLGAIQAYELARWITSEPSRRAVHLVVSGSASPLLKRRGKATGLSDDEFVREVESLAGYTHPALADREMRGLLLPALRADVEMHESYVHEWAVPLEINITCVHGKGDEIVKASEAEQWRDVTQGTVDLLYAEGEHMFWVDDAAFLISKIKAVAANLVAQEVKNAA